MFQRNRKFDVEEDVKRQEEEEEEGETVPLLAGDRGSNHNYDNSNINAYDHVEPGVERLLDTHHGYTNTQFVAHASTTSSTSPSRLTTRVVDGNVIASGVSNGNNNSDNNDVPTEPRPRTYGSRTVVAISTPTPTPAEAARQRRSEREIQKARGRARRRACVGRCCLNLLVVVLVILVVWFCLGVGPFRPAIGFGGGVAVCPSGDDYYRYYYNSSGTSTSILSSTSFAGNDNDKDEKAEFVDGATNFQSTTTMTKLANDSHHDAPAVGFALSLSHASAAIVWPNGTVETVGPVSADEAYVDVMKRLAEPSSRHIRPPYYGMLLGPGPDEWARQWWRSTRKTLGFAASSDVGTLLQPLKPLLVEVTKRLGCRPSDGLLITVGVQAIYDEDIDDIMSYLGLNQTRLYHMPAFAQGCDQGHELASAFAANDFGLCPTYWDPVACKKEEANMTTEYILGISYTRKGIAVSNGQFSSAYMIWQDSWSDAIGFDGLGSDDKAKYATEDEYWNLMKEKLTPLIDFRRWRNHTRLFIFDEVSPEESSRLQEIVQSIVRQWQPEVKVYDSNPLFMTAIGAAKFAQRGRYVALKPWSRTEPSDSGSEHSKRFPDPLSCPYWQSNIR